MRNGNEKNREEVEINLVNNKNFIDNEDLDLLESIIIANRKTQIYRKRKAVTETSQLQTKKIKKILKSI